MLTSGGRDFPQLPLVVSSGTGRVADRHPGAASPHSTSTSTHGKDTRSRSNCPCDRLNQPCVHRSEEEQWSGRRTVGHWLNKCESTSPQQSSSTGNPENHRKHSRVSKSGSIGGSNPSPRRVYSTTSVESGDSGSGKMISQDIRQELLNLPYYHSGITGSEPVKSVLKDCDTGSYLLRNCGQHKGICAVSVVDQTVTTTRIRHFAVNGRQGHYFIQDKLQFPTLQRLVDYYAINEVPNAQEIKDVRLINPVYSTDVEDAPYQYASPEDEDRTEALLSALIRHSQLTDSEESAQSSADSQSARCECGLRVGEVELPGGWTVHKSDGHQKLFYQHENGESKWELPEELSLSPRTATALAKLEQREFYSSGGAAAHSRNTSASSVQSASHR